MTEFVLYQRGDAVLVDLNGGTGLEPKWVPAIVSADTNTTYGWTPAKTAAAEGEPSMSRGPGWLPNEIRYWTPSL